MADSTFTTVPAATRKVVGLMAFAVIFSVVGLELKRNQQGQSAPSQGAGLSGPAKIILGGTIATALLSFLAEAGAAGEQIGVGLAGITAVTAMLVTGGPVWTGIGNLFGGAQGATPTGQTGATAVAGATSIVPYSAPGGAGQTYPIAVTAPSTNY
jgi:hypothetical protein